MAWTPSTYYWKYNGYDSEKEYRDKLTADHNEYVRKLWIGWSIAAVVALVFAAWFLMNVGGWIESDRVWSECYEATKHKYLVNHWPLEEARHLAKLEC